MINRVDLSREEFDVSYRDPLAGADADIRESVRDILTRVRDQGWEGVSNASEEFDGVRPDRRPIPEEHLLKQWNRLDEPLRKSLRIARERIRRYQQSLLRRSRLISDGDGELGEIVRPYHRVGCYIPGGRFPLPSTVLMTAYIAEVAGVEEIIVCSPPGESGTPNPVIQATASLLEDVEVYGIGGVQAIGAMTYGAGEMDPVDLVVGPGNIYVTVAKKEVYGRVEIDMLAGPSEIAIIAEEDRANPEYITADLLSQAEHDPLSRSYCLSPSDSLLDQVEQQLSTQLEQFDDTELLEQSLSESALIQCSDLQQAIDRTNQLAPEHLELHVANPSKISRQINNAGAIFCGDLSPEPIGDYLAGPSHTLPTGGSARFFQPLSVETFRKKQSYINMGPQTFSRVRAAAETIAGIEQLPAHAQSLSRREDDSNE